MDAWFRTWFVTAIMFVSVVVVAIGVCTSEDSGPPTAATQATIEAIKSPATMATQLAALGPTPTRGIVMPTREPTPDIEELISRDLEGHFRKLRADDPRARFTCAKRVLYTYGVGVCFGRGDYPDGVKKVSAWRWMYSIGGNSQASTEMELFAYSPADAAGILMSCDSGGCSNRVVSMSEGIRFVEQAAARWNEEVR